MKKLAISLIVGASLIITPSAFALKAMTDSNMKAATGQAGVSIALDDVTIFQSVGETLYTDIDGTNGTAASIRISGKETLTTLRAIFDDTNRDGFLQRSYAEYLNREDAAANAAAVAVLGASATATEIQTWIDDTANAATVAAAKTASGGDIEIAALSIDVSNKVEALSYGMAYNHRNDLLDFHTTIAIADYSSTADANTNGVNDNIETVAGALGLDVTDAEDLATATAQFGVLQALDGSADQAAYSFGVAQASISVAGVVIGLPTLEIVKTGDTQNIGIVATGSINSGADYIQTTKSDSVMAVLGGTIEICPH